MTRCATAAVLFALALFSLAQPAAVPAVALTWNVAGGGDWNTTSPNWSGDATLFPDDATAAVVFDNTAGGTISIAPNMTPASVTVSAASGTYTFTGGPIDGAGGLTKSGNGLLVINSANSFTGATTINYGRITISHAGALGLGGGNITAVGSNGNTGSLLALTGGITVNGALRLQATSSGRASLINAGGSNVWAGTIDITGNGGHAMLQVDSGSLTVTGDITGTLTGGSFYIRGSGTSQITGSININGSLNKRDGGTWIIGNTTTPKTYSWNATTVDLGVLGFAAANIHPASRVLTLGSDQAGSAVFMLGNGTTGFDQTVAGLATTGSTATRKIVGGGTNVATLTVNNAATHTFSGTLGGTGTHENNLALTKSGSGTLTLSGTTANTHAGLTTVSGGTLILAKSADVDAVGGDVAVTGGTLQWNAAHQLPDTTSLVQTGGTVAFNGMSETLANFTKSGGTTQTGGNSAVITITDTFALSGGTTFNFNSPSTIVANKMLHTGGTITLGGSGTLLDIGPGGLEMTGSTITLNPGSPGSTVRLGGDVTIHASSTSARIALGSGTVANTVVDLNGGTRTFAVANGAAANDLVIDAFIRNGGLIKAGDGTMLVTGTNTYAGTTSVHAGTLVLNGVHTGGGAYTVAAGATLAGSGSTNAPVFLENDGILSPGNSPGTLSIGSLTLADASILSFELDAPNSGNSALSDRIDVAGDLVLNGILNVETLAGFGTPEVGDRWRLFNYTGTLTDLGLDVLLTSLPALSPELRYEIDTSVAHQVDLLVGVPEPSSLLLVALGLLGLLARRR